MLQKREQAPKCGSNEEEEEEEKEKGKVKFSLCLTH
jgi:hypothetical protein